MNDFNEEDWISAAEALQINQRKVGDSLWVQILERARDGITQARAQRYFVTGGQPPHRVERSSTLQVLEKKFFWAASGSALEKNWITGDFSTWIDKKWHCRAFGVQFRRSEIEAMVPPAAEDYAQSEPISNLPKHTDAELSEWIRRAPMAKADVAHEFYKIDPQFNGIKQPEFRKLCKTIKGTNRGRQKTVKR